MTAGIGAFALASSGIDAADRNTQSLFGPTLYGGADLAFGTTVSIRVVHSNAYEARVAIRKALAQARTIDRLMSIYRKGSQVYTLNKTGKVAFPDAHLLTVLREALRFSSMTNGAFDVTVQPLWLAAVAGEDTSEAHRLVNWCDLQVDNTEVRLLRAGMAITLNGIAQGYATDLALEMLRAHGIRHALVDIGELAAIGQRAADAPWQAGVTDPRNAGRVLRTVSLDGRCLATSGDYASAFDADYSKHHILNPDTAYSPSELASVSVIAPTAMLADGLSTGLMVMGREQGMRLIRKLNRVDALFIDKAGKKFRSSGFPPI